MYPRPRNALNTSREDWRLAATALVYVVALKSQRWESVLVDCAVVVSAIVPGLLAGQHERRNVA